MSAPVWGAQAHLLLEALSYGAGSALYWLAPTSLRSGPTNDMPLEQRLAVLAGAAMGALLGSRGLYLAQYWHALPPLSLAVLSSGKTIVGGLLGGLIGVELAKRATGWRASTGDRFVLALTIGIVLGRIGCHLAGLGDLTYGNVTTLPWGIDAGDGLPRHPVALYEVLVVPVLAIAIVRAPALRQRAGDRFAAFLVAYLLLRLLLDFLKPPYGPAATGLPTPDLWLLLTPIQWACMAGLAYYSAHLRRWLRRGASDA